jgi:hypothetical protein
MQMIQWIVWGILMVVWVINVSECVLLGVL